MTAIADQQARSRALNPDRSFIVQAPAGSGKTGLLTQRFLVLLAGVENPEEITAVTFTRKAAREMQHRILSALKNAKNNPLPDNPYDRRMWSLGKNALQRDTEKGWQLLNNPGRLRIRTIDSLCASLTQQMPLMANFGAPPGISDEAESFYTEAARNTLQEINHSSPWSESVSHLIQHMDNRQETLSMLLADMLKKRDQWLRHITEKKLNRQSLEDTLQRITLQALEKAASCSPREYAQELFALFRFSCAHQQTNHPETAQYSSLSDYPGTTIADLSAWRMLACFLFTQGGTWRKLLTKKEGFPPESSATTQEEKEHFKQMKQRMKSLLGELQHAVEFRSALLELIALPPLHYNEPDWQTLQALLDVLPVAVAHLELVFKAQGKIDYPALTMAALASLGSPENPTDLALSMDYRIRHLLVDEFQDTSYNQFILLERLTAGWQPGDGRSLFLVGDPMQSIYRFREADVGLFLRAKKYGLGDIPLESLQLTVNFRSQQGIIDWSNAQFPKIFPAYNDMETGAISYSPSTAFHTPLPIPAVTVHPSLQNNTTDEARQVIQLIRQAKKSCPTGTTAVLARNRSHLHEIIQQLQQADLRFQAVEIARLTQRPVIQDLMALTRALLHCGDRVAWLAVLRAPFCGFTLADLYTLSTDKKGHPRSNTTILDLLQQSPPLSHDGQQRLARCLPVLKIAFTEQLRGSLRNYIEGTWLMLGGAACLHNTADIEDAEVYFQLLEHLHTAGHMRPDRHTLADRVNDLFALPHPASDASLQLMTIHKSKGLEFDTVILPGLGRRPKNNSKKLLYWAEYANGKDLLLAPLQAHGDETNPMAAYIEQLDTQKGLFEDQRLLYVAATRAKHQLHLLGHTGVHIKNGQATLKNPEKKSLLARLWPAVHAEYQKYLNTNPDNFLEDNTNEPTSTPPSHRIRLLPDWQPPDLPDAIAPVTSSTPVQQKIEQSINFDWAGEPARHLGIIMHRLLQYIGETGIENITLPEQQYLQTVAYRLLNQHGVPKHLLAAVKKDMQKALQTVFNDPQARWILSTQHTEARCELALTHIHKDKIEHKIIDRTFIDAQGTRWIIDYKTGRHLADDTANFLDQEQERYRSQLEEYACIIRKMDKKSPIHLGLYFPLLKGWREWPFK